MGEKIDLSIECIFILLLALADTRDFSWNQQIAIKATKILFAFIIDNKSRHFSFYIKGIMY